MRVHELAKELGVAGEELLAALKAMGMDGLTALSSVPDEAVARLRASGGKSVSQAELAHVVEEPMPTTPARTKPELEGRAPLPERKPGPTPEGKPAPPEAPSHPIGTADQAELAAPVLKRPHGVITASVVRDTLLRPEMIDAVALAVIVFLEALVGLDVQGPVRGAFAVAFFTFVPGWAVVTNWTSAARLSRLALSVLLSLAIGTAAATTTLWLHIWSPLGLFYVTAIGCSIAITSSLVRRRAGRSAPEPPPLRDQRERDESDRLSVARLHRGRSDPPPATVEDPSIGR